MKIAIVILVITVLIFVFIAVDNSSRADIKAWAATQGYSVVSIDETVFDAGPYWIKSKGQRIYRCVLLDESGHRRLMYMRTGLFENDYEFYGDEQ